MSRPTLGCYLNEALVATVTDVGMGQCAVQYVDSCVDEHAGERLLSVRLPVRQEPYPSQGGAQPFLDGLLPEGWIRAQLADNARLAPDDTFGLLQRYGGDCAGAVTFRPLDEPPVPPDVRWLTNHTLEEALRDLRALPLGDGTDGTIRLSLGGMQEKLVVVGDGERFGIPVGSHPSTHILKPTPLNLDGTERYPGMAAVEFLCMQLAATIADDDDDRRTGIGFRVPATDMLELSGRSVLSVHRFDRACDPSGSLVRLHQEDGCQALGLPPGRKYQLPGQEEPSLSAFAMGISRWGADPLLDQRALLQHVTYSVCIGNADLHAKNLAILHDGGAHLAPAYDLVTTAGYGVQKELGLRVDGQHHLDDVRSGHLVAEAERWGLGAVAAQKAIRVVLDGVMAHLDPVAEAVELDGAEPVVSAAVRDIRSRVRVLLKG